MSIKSQIPEEKPDPVTEPGSTDQQEETTTSGGTEESKQDNGPVEEEIIQEPIIVDEPEEVNPQEAALAQMGDLKIYKRGDLAEGAVVQVLDDSLIVDIGTKSEGIITREEIGIGPSPDLSVFSVGDMVKAVVINEDDEGIYHLSKRRADQMLVWEKVEESQTNGTRLEAAGFRAVKGGLLVDIGTIAFLPQSLVDIRRIDDLEPLVGQKFDVKVVEYDRDAKPHPKIVVSRRSVLEEDLTRERDQIYDQLKPGAVVDGKVIKLTNYGAFVDVGGIQGLLHISEMSLGRIKHPNEVMKENDTIKVKILKIEKKKKRISLGRRDLLPNPWESIREKFKPGMVVEGIVVRTADFGAFVKLDEYFEGLAHISELVDNKISHAKEVFSPGDKVNVFIMGIDKKARRIKLSIRRAADAQRKAEVAEFMNSQGDLENVFASQLQEALKESELELHEKKPDAKPEAETPETAEPQPEPVEAEPVDEVTEPEAVAETEVTEETVTEDAEPEPEPAEEKTEAEETKVDETVEVSEPEEAPEPSEEKTEAEPAAAEEKTEPVNEEPEQETSETEAEAAPVTATDSSEEENDLLGSTEMDGTPL